MREAVTGPAGPAQRRAIAKVITLLESSRDDHRARAEALLDALQPAAGGSLRVGISGVPGVGKSTFIEALGLRLVADGRRVAVLAVDPSSTVHGGSILGDKTRMERLSVEPRAFIRPSPSRGALGGVADATREAMRVFEAAGHDVVLVETVGVGQSEVAVAGMTDVFVLLQLPNAGDDLQAIKRGVMERADIVAINKADLDESAATRAQAQITSALRLMRMHHQGAGDDGEPDVAQRVMRLSALAASGLDAFWSAVTGLAEARRASGAFEARRRAQDEHWFWERVDAGLRRRFERHAAVRSVLPQVIAAVRAGTLAPTVAARDLLRRADAPS